MKWTRSLPEYSAGDGWALTYYFAGTTAFTAAATADGDLHAVTIPAVTTAPLAPGTFQYLARAAKAGEVYTVDSGAVVVSPNLAAVTSYQSHAEKMVALLEAAIEAEAAGTAAGGTGGTVRSYTIGDRSVEYRDVDELQARLAHYKWQVWREQHPGRLGPRRQVRFVG